MSKMRAFLSLLTFALFASSLTAQGRRRAYTQSAEYDDAQVILLHEPGDEIFLGVMHPDAMVRFGMNWSRSNRAKRGGMAHVFGGDDDYLVKFSREYLAENQDDADYFVFGHLHTPVDYTLNDRSRMIVLGEWVENPVYAIMDSGKCTIRNFNDN